MKKIGHIDVMFTYILKFVWWKSAKRYGHCSVKTAEKEMLLTTVFSGAHDTTAVQYRRGGGVQKRHFFSR
jgi:hypothetical protein